MQSIKKFKEDKLKDVCVLVTDGTHDSPKLQKEGIPFIKGKHISKGYIDFDNCDYIRYDDHLQVIKRSKPERGDILFSNIGSVGDTAFIDTDIEFSIKNVALLKPNTEKILNKYLYYCVKSEEFQNKIKSILSGVAQPFIGLDTLRNFTIKYHKDLTDQANISSILSAYDDLIENNTRRIRILEEMAQAIYREWFVEFRLPAVAGAPGVKLRKTTPEEKKAIGKDVIPERWGVVELGEIAHQVRRSIKPNGLNSTVNYIGLEHLPRKSIALSEWEKTSYIGSTKLSFQKREVLFGKIRPYFHKVGIAPVNGLCSSDIIVISPIEVKHTNIILSITSSDHFVKYATITSQGTKMPRANWDVLKKYPVVMPGTNIIDRFNRIVGNMIDLIHKLIFRNHNLRQTRDLLLPKLVSGEVEV